MSESHVTDPHGWPVETDTYSAPCTSGSDVRVVFKQPYPGPSIAVCIAEGYEREDTHLTADEARGYARLLMEAADILEAFERGDYTPPPSAYDPPEPTPFQKAMMASYLSGMTEMLNRTGLLDGPDGKPGVKHHD